MVAVLQVRMELKHLKQKMKKTSEKARGDSDTMAVSAAVVVAVNRQGRHSLCRL